jgi:hypothetical protein
MGLLVDVAGVITPEVRTLKVQVSTDLIQTDGFKAQVSQDRMYLLEAFVATTASKQDTWHVTVLKMYKAVRVF